MTDDANKQILECLHEVQRRGQDIQRHREGQDMCGMLEGWVTDRLFVGNTTTPQGRGSLPAGSRPDRGKCKV